MQIARRRGKKKAIVALARVCVRRFLQGVKLRSIYVEIDIGKDCHQAKAWHCFDEDVLSFAVRLVPEDTDARCIAVWPRQRGYQSGPQQIGSDRDDRNGFRRLLN